MTRTRGNTRLLALACATTLLASGCAGSQDGAATSAAQGLLTAVRDGDGAAACRVLAQAAADDLETTSGKPCERAVLDEDLGPGTGEAHVEVFDSMAQVRLGVDTLFLSRYDGRWRVVGAACTPVTGRPYDCSIGLP